MRFSLLSMVVLALIATVLASFLQQEMENDALQQQADEVATVMDGMIGQHLTAAAIVHGQQPVYRAWWVGLADRLLSADRHLVRVKVWDLRGRVVYSNNPTQIGQVFPLNENLRTALSGQRAMDVSNLSESENVGDRSGHTALLETYVPILSHGQVIGVYEGYSDLSILDARLDSARHLIWLSVGLGFLILYISLFAIVYQASRRLIRQMHEINRLDKEAREAAALREVDRLKDEFIGNISHELRRPLASIKGYTASLLLRDAVWEPEVQQEFLQVIDEESDHLAALIDNLLDLARLGTGSLVLSKEPLHLPALIKGVVQRITTQSQLPRHSYVTNFPDHFPFVEADSARISQVLLNLLENAAKYSPAGTPIMVEGAMTDGRIMISVRDDGPGLTADQAQRVFDKFYRVDSGLTRMTEGSGLGLAICRGIIVAHDGDITVSATPGHGCTFTISLPAITTRVADDPRVLGYPVETAS